MANRHILAITKLDDFRDWLIADGWEIQDTKGYYEVLRARKQGRRNPLIVYKRLDAKEHLSVSDNDISIVRAYMADTRQKIKIFKYEHKGYALEQSSYNWHYFIYNIESGEAVLRVTYPRKLTAKKAKEQIEAFITLKKILAKKKKGDEANDKARQAIN